MARARRRRVREMKRRVREIARLQEQLYADGRHALLVVLQGMDASGKDGTVRHVFSGVNPQGVIVHSFKEPTPREAREDFLWRVHQAVPQRGKYSVSCAKHLSAAMEGGGMSRGRAGR